MKETRKLALRLLSYTISLLLYCNAGDAKENLLPRPANRTRGQYPISEFRTHMFHAVSALSVPRQCTILAAILEDSGESSQMKEYMNTVAYQHLPCFPMTISSRSAVNASGMSRATNYYFSRLFNTLPLPFQCKIISDVTFAPRGETTRAMLAQTISKLNEKLNLVDNTKECVDMNARGVITNSRVQLGVRIRKTMPLDVWLERFKKILPTLYLSYISKSGRISEFVTAWRRNEKGAKVPVIPVHQFLVKFHEKPIVDGSVAIITFSLYSRSSSGDYRVINGDEVAASFDDINRSVLHSYLQAEVIGWRAHGERFNSRFMRMRNGNNRLTALETYKLQASLPKYLVKYFKSMSGYGRCYILRHIASHAERDLSTIEKRYRSLGILPKKYYCSRASRYEEKSKATNAKKLPSIWARLDEYMKSISKPTLALTTITPARNSTVIRETRPLNSMEIVMFVLLSFLCLLIMVFVANCVVFTFKTKKLNSKYFADLPAPQEVLRDAIPCEDRTCEAPPGKLCLTENPRPRFDDSERYETLFSGMAPNLTGNMKWRLLSMTSEGEVTLCDVISSDDELERVSSV